MKTNELTGAALDWAVAKCENRTILHDPMKIDWRGYWIWEETPSGKGGIILSESVYQKIGPTTKPSTKPETQQRGYSPSTNWQQGGPIIERAGIDVCKVCPDTWRATPLHSTKWNNGHTPLVAAMRCYVASKLGDEINVPSLLRS